MFYKILMDGVIVDALKNPRYVKWQERNGLIVSVKNEKSAGGILSSDGSMVYHIDGLPGIPAEGIATVTLEKISGAEYKTLREQLDEGLTPVLPEEEATGEESTETVLTMAQLQQKVLQFEKFMTALTEKLNLNL